MTSRDQASAMTSIRQLTPEVTIFSAPFERFGLIKVGSRATAIKLDSGNVFLYNPVQMDESVKNALNKLGPVKFVVAPDFEHHIFVEAYKKEYPDSVVIGVDGLEKKKRGLVPFDMEYGGKNDGTKFGFENELEARYFPGFVNRDVCFLHKKSRSLLVADLLFNMPAHEQYQNTSNSATSGILNRLASHFNPYSVWHRRFLWYSTKSKEREKLAADAAHVNSWDFDRIIPAHGNVVETDGRKAWESAYSYFLDRFKSS